MASSDRKTSTPPPLSPTLDAPPSYDAVATPSDVGGSGSSSNPPPFLPSAPPKETLHLFSGPPNAEALLGRSNTPLEVLNSIESEKKGNWIVSSDRRLENASTLYDYIRNKTLVQPQLLVHCTGVHFETPERNEYVEDRDGPRHRRKGQPERIVDFEFTIDLTSIINHPDNYANVHLSTALPDAPVARGSHGSSYSALYALPPTQSHDYSALLGPTDAGRHATRAENKLNKEWCEWRTNRGLPPWAKMKDHPDFVDSKGKSRSEPSQPIRLGEGTELDMGEEEVQTGPELERAEREAMLKAWCERYVSDPGLLKEFRVPYFIWGWDIEGLTTAIKGAITSTGYNSNHVTVEIKPDTAGLVIKPSNLLSRAINKTFVYALLWMTLLYPIIWLWQRFHRLGGAPYDVARATYGLKYYPPLPSTFPTESLAQAQDRLGGMYKIHRELPKPTQLVPGPKGIHYLLGRKEGEWFREWEERIRMGVRMRFRGELQGGGEEEAGTGLDGY